MKLFYTKSSPYANCVRAVITELGIGAQVDMVESHPFDNDPEFLSASPLGKVPCLLAEGEIILDSEVICDFLDASFSGGVLFNPVYADWRLKVLYSICSGLMDTCVARRMEQMREDEGSKSDFWFDRFSSGIERSLSHIEQKLPLFPEEFSILHIALHVSLAYIDFRHEDIDWRSRHPQLAEFFQQHQARPSLAENPIV